MRTKLMMTTLLAALVLAGCATPPPIDETKLPATPAGWKSDATAAVGEARWAVVPPADAEPRGDWWLAFGDATLNDLIRRSLAGNTDLQSAAARLAQARTLLRSADADRLPQVGASAGAARGTVAGQGPAATTVWNAGLAASWEVDISGRLSQASRAASLDAQSREVLL